MKAILYTKYGSPEVLHQKDVEKPVPNNNEVLVKVHATTVTAGDVRMRSFNVPRWQWLFARVYLGISKPKRPILGMELSAKLKRQVKMSNCFTKVIKSMHQPTPWISGVTPSTSASLKMGC